MYIDEKLIFRDIITPSKHDVLYSLCDKLAEKGIIDSSQDFFEIIWDREINFSTGIGRNVAIPHGMSSQIKATKLVVGIVPDGVEYESIDGEKVQIIFMFAIASDCQKEYMTLLSKLTAFARSESNRTKLINAKSEKEIFNIIREVINE